MGIGYIDGNSKRKPAATLAAGFCRIQNGKDKKNKQKKFLFCILEIWLLVLKTSKKNSSKKKTKGGV